MWQLGRNASASTRRKAGRCTAALAGLALARRSMQQRGEDREHHDDNAGPGGGRRGPGRRRTVDPGEGPGHASRRPASSSAATPRTTSWPWIATASCSPTARPPSATSRPAAADLAAPRESVSTSAAAVTTAQSDVASAQKELADAQAALASANAAAAGASTSATPAPPSTHDDAGPAGDDQPGQAGRGRLRQDLGGHHRRHPARPGDGLVQLRCPGARDRMAEAARRRGLPHG